VAYGPRYSSVVPTFFRMYMATKIISASGAKQCRAKNLVLRVMNLVFPEGKFSTIKLFSTYGGSGFTCVRFAIFELTQKKLPYCVTKDCPENMSTWDQTPDDYFASPFKN